MKRKVLLALAVVGSLVLIMVVATELYLRNLGLGDPILYYTNSSYGYAPVPNQRRQRFNGSWVSIDSYGLRGVEDWGADADSHILFIGDSVTWSGTSWDDSEIFPSLVCDELERERGGNFVCGNAGVNVYGVDNMTARIRSKKFDNEDVIVVVILPLDTIRGLTNFGALPYFARKPPEPFPAIWETAAFFMTRWERRMRGKRRLRYVHDLTVTEEDLEVASRSLANLFAALEVEGQKGKAILLAYTPASWEIEIGKNRLSTHVKRLMAASGFAFVDLTDVVREHYSDGFYWERDEIHLDVAGHRQYGVAIAREVSKLLSKRGDESVRIQPPPSSAFR